MDAVGANPKQLAAGSIKSEPPFMPSSPWRLLRDRVVGLVVSLFRAIESLVIQRPKIDISKFQNKSFYSALHCIKQAGLLSDNAVLEYLSALEGLKVDSSLLIGASCEGNPEARFVAIPLILSGLFRNHIVMLFVDKEAHQIEFYDPKGLAVNDQSGRKLSRAPTKALKETIEAIWNTFASANGSKWTFKENAVRHQSDGYNCGVYVSDFVRRRLNGETFESIQANGLSFTDANGPMRDEMMKTIITKGITAPPIKFSDDFFE